MYTIQISKHIKISFYNFCSNQFFLLVCHSANCVVCKTEMKHDLNFLHNPFPLSLTHFFICRLHSLCLQFKSFCPVLWIYNQNNSSVSGRSGRLVGWWRYCWAVLPLLRVCVVECEWRPAEAQSGASTLVELFFFFVGVIVQHAKTCNQALNIINQNKILTLMAHRRDNDLCLTGSYRNMSVTKGWPCSHFSSFHCLPGTYMYANMFYQREMSPWTVASYFTKPFQKVHEDSWFRS